MRVIDKACNRLPPRGTVTGFTHGGLVKRSKMRTRVFDDKVITRSYPSTYSQAGRMIVNNQVLYTGGILSSRMNDVVTPRYSERSAAGEIIQSPKAKEIVNYTVFASLFHMHCILPGGTYTEHDSGSLVRVGLTTPQVLITDPVLWQKAYEQFRQENDLAVTRAHAAVDVSEMMLLASVGELPETVAWLTSLIQRLVKVSRAFTKRREMVNILRKLTYDLQEATLPKGAKFAARRLDLYKQLLQKRSARAIPPDRIGEAATAWLEYRYAIRPLLGDIKNAIAAIKALLPYGRRQTARGKELRVYDDITYDAGDINSPSLYVEDLKIERAGSIKASAGVLYAIERNINALSALLGLDQPVESLYELIPFSFVLDWVVGVGDWLQSLTKSSGLTVLSSWNTLSYVETCKVTPSNGRAHYNPTDSHQWVCDRYVAGSLAYKVERVWRMPNPSIPLLPSFDLKLDISKILDLGFILRQTMSGQNISVVKRS